MGPSVQVGCRFFKNQFSREVGVIFQKLFDSPSTKCKPMLVCHFWMVLLVVVMWFVFGFGSGWLLVLFCLEMLLECCFEFCFACDAADVVRYFVPDV